MTTKFSKRFEKIIDMNRHSTQLKWISCCRWPTSGIGNHLRLGHINLVLWMPRWMGIGKKSILSRELKNVNLKIVFILKREMYLICIQKARLKSDRLIRYIFSIASNHKILKLTCQIAKSARHEKCIPFPRFISDFHSDFLDFRKIPHFYLLIMLK